jgi:hypothetical protein
MNATDHPGTQRTPPSVAQAKAELLARGEAGDARAAEFRANAGTGLERLAIGGAIATVAVLIVRRLLPVRRPPGSSGAAGGERPVGRSAAGEPSAPGARRWLSWILIARAGRWLLPHAINAVSHMQAARRERRAGQPHPVSQQT